MGTWCHDRDSNPTLLTTAADADAEDAMLRGWFEVHLTFDNISEHTHMSGMSSLLEAFNSLSFLLSC